MAYRYINPDAKCPFYRMEDPCVVHCEGLAEGLGINLEISSRDEARTWKRTYCQDNWMGCFLAKMMWKQYEDSKYLKDFKCNWIRNDNIEWMSSEERKRWDEENRP